MGPRNQGLQGGLPSKHAAMEGTAADVGAVRRLTLHAKCILEEAINTDDRLEALSGRLFGGGPAPQPGTNKDGPEPIRSDVEELEYVLGMLGDAVASGSDRLKRLEQL